MNFSELLHGFELLMYFSPFAKKKQAKVLPRFQSLLKLLLWTKGVEWIEYSMYSIPWICCTFGNVFNIGVLGPHCVISLFKCIAMVVRSAADEAELFSTGLFSSRQRMIPIQSWYSCYENQVHWEVVLVECTSWTYGYRIIFIYCKDLGEKEEGLQCGGATMEVFGSISTTNNVAKIL